MSQYDLRFGTKLATFFPVSNNEEFKEMLNTSKQVLDQKWNQKNKYSIRSSDFEIIKTIGVGGNGTVYLIRHITAPDKTNLPYYAMKKILKREIILKRRQRFVLMEKKVWESIDFRFAVKHFFNFKDNAHLYFITEYMPGGDLFNLLKKFRRFEESMVKFYAAQVALAFEYLHFMGIIYRDLKPQNIVMGRDGFVKIGDFGTSKKIDDRKTNTFIGTPEYQAPEIILSLPYSYEVDWWTFGIFIFELSRGEPPYYGSNNIKMFQQILSQKIKFPDYFTSITQKVIQDLTKYDPKARLPNADAVKKHDFFKEVDWINMLNKNIKPPFMPMVTTERDTRNFITENLENIDDELENLYVREFVNF